VIKKIIKLLYSLLFAKFTFFLPPKRKFFIFGTDRAQDFQKYIPVNKSHVLNFSEHVNFSILLKCIFKMDVGSSSYFKEYINFVDPKFVISIQDLYPQFYLIEKRKKRKKILIQGAWRAGDPNFNKNKKYYVDYFLGFNSAISKKYKDLLGAKVFNIGSFRSNSYKIYKEKKVFDILYISTFRIIKKNNSQFDETSWKKFDKPQIDLIKHLFEYSKKKKLKLYIYGKASPDIRNFQTIQKNYFKKILGKKGWSYLENFNNDVKSVQNTYKKIDQAKIVVGTDSTLLYEALSRGSKVAFFNHRSQLKGYGDRSYGWPLKKSKEGPFWTGHLSKNSCFDLMDKVISYKNNKWKSIALKESKQVILRDNNNSIFKSLIK